MCKSALKRTPKLSDVGVRELNGTEHDELVRFVVRRNYVELRRTDYTSKVKYVVIYYRSTLRQKKVHKDEICLWIMHSYVHTLFVKTGEGNFMDFRAVLVFFL